MVITAEERQIRRGFLGASDLGAVFGVDPFRTAYDLYCEKKYDLDEKEDNDAIALGNALEASLVYYCGKKKLLDVERNVRYEEGIFAANCDAVSVCGRIVVEAKTTSRPWEWGPEGTDQVPWRVTLQVQQQMWLAHAELAYVVVLMPVGGRLTLRIYEVPRNEEIIQRIKSAGMIWWSEHIIQDMPPSEDPTLSVVQRIIRHEEPTPVDVEHGLMAEWAAAQKGAKEANAELTRTKARVIAALGDQTLGITEDGWEISYGEQHRKEYTVKAASYRVLRVKKPKGLSSGEEEGREEEGTEA